MSMAIAIAAGCLVATMLFLALLSLDTLRRFTRQKSTPEFSEEQLVPEHYPDN